MLDLIFVAELATPVNMDLPFFENDRSVAENEPYVVPIIIDFCIIQCTLQFREQTEFGFIADTKLWGFRTMLQ